MKATNVTRLLDHHKIPYKAFELPAQKLSALEAAQYLDVSPELVYKTIVALPSSKPKPVLALLPATKELDLKALAQALGEKKVNLPTQKEAERLTGLQAGGISPLALLNRNFPTIIDSTAKNHAEIYISAGQRGLNIRLPVDALIELTGASIYDIGK